MYSECTLMGRVEYSVLCLYSECTFGAQRGVRKVHAEYTSCAEYNVKYVEYCLRSLAIPFGHLRDLIAFAGSHCLPVGYFILWDFGSVLWDACGL